MVAARASAPLSGGHYTALGYRAVDAAHERGQRIPIGGSADYQTRYSREQLVRMSQGFDRDNCLYAGMLSRAVDNIVGCGFGLQARTKNPELNKTIESLWGEWALEPEVRGLFAWWQIERLALRSILRDGDVGGIKTTSRKMQMVEAEQIATTRAVGKKDQDTGLKCIIEQGVELNGVGRPMRFFVAPFSRYGMTQKIGATAIESKDFVFIAHRERFSQTRGIPPCVPAFPMIHRIDDICNAEAIARQMLSRLAFAIIRAGAGDTAYLEGKPNPNPPNPGQTDIADRILEMPSAVVANLNVGEDIKAIARSIPGPDFEATLVAFLRFAGLPLGMPLELLLLDWSKTNYSSARAALEQAFKMFQCWQQLLRERLHGPIYRWLIDGWIAEGKLARTSDIYEHDWIVPEFPWLDLLKEATAWGIKMDRGISTHTESLKSQNKDRDKFLATRKREVLEAIETAKAIKKETGEDVDWRMFCGLPGASADAKAVEKQGAPTGDWPEKKPDPTENPNRDRKDEEDRDDNDEGEDRT